jgi:hypothetical protein
MDHETICDCLFKAHCETYHDPLIAADRKGPDQLGCVGAIDVHRAKHCRSFACKYLCVVLTDALRQPPPAPIQ